MVQPHARSVLVRTAYDLGLSPHTHQPGPLAMAAHVLRGLRRGSMTLSL